MSEIKLDKRSVQAVGKLKGADNLTRRAIRQALFKSGKDIKSTANQHILDKNKAGRLYTVTVNGRRRKHRASAPGQPPANLTGDLRKSLSFLVIGSRELQFGADTPYARALELGNEKRNLEPRPYLRLSIEDNRRNMERYFQTRIKIVWDKEFQS